MSYKILEHTADIRMLVQGGSLKELFSDAVLGMMKILKSDIDNRGKEVQRTISVEAMDTTALLIDFLSEVLLAVQINKEIYNKVNFKNFSEQSLKAVLIGKAAQSLNEDIKAVTYHEAEIKKNEDGIWETKIVFDV